MEGFSISVTHASTSHSIYTQLAMAGPTHHHAFRLPCLSSSPHPRTPLLPLIFIKAILFLWGHVMVSEYDLIVIREGGVPNI